VREMRVDAYSNNALVVALNYNISAILPLYQRGLKVRGDKAVFHVIFI
jgi:hypothetical protein